VAGRASEVSGSGAAAEGGEVTTTRLDCRAVPEVGKRVPPNGGCLRHDILHDFGFFDACEPEVETRMAVSQFAMIEAHQL